MVIQKASGKTVTIPLNITLKWHTDNDKEKSLNNAITNIIQELTSQGFNSQAQEIKKYINDNTSIINKPIVSDMDPEINLNYSYNSGSKKLQCEVRPSIFKLNVPYYEGCTFNFGKDIIDIELQTPDISIYTPAPPTPTYKPIIVTIPEEYTYEPVFLQKDGN